jgi:dGTPase
MLMTRERLEGSEDANLAPYAMRSSQTRGRAVAEDEHRYRTRFQRDRDRIIYTTAFRRLEYKTQVFVTYEGDYYRTRLTHTLEGAEIGRTIARVLGANEDLVEAITLAHDLGHPPFGHSGEEALHSLMKECGGFEHNSHSLRIVDELEERYPGWRGLNLTWEVREGIIKHVTTYDRADASALEAQIVSAADEIAYNNHDLDDGLRSAMIAPGELAGVALWEEARSTAGGDIDDMTRHRIVRRLIGWQVDDLLEETERRIQRYGVSSVKDVRDCPSMLVGFSEKMEAKRAELKRFLYARLYRHYRVVRMAEKARRVVTELFDSYVAMPDQLPRWVQERAEVEPLRRAICDYLAGMTDRYAIEEHCKLFDPQTRV